LTNRFVHFLQESRLKVLPNYCCPDAVLLVVRVTRQDRTNFRLPVVLPPLSSTRGRPLPDTGIQRTSLVARRPCHQTGPDEFPTSRRPTTAFVDSRPTFARHRHTTHLTFPSDRQGLVVVADPCGDGRVNRPPSLFNNFVNTHTHPSSNH
jgi:hypothetical protein